MARSASHDGFNPSCSSRARTKRSMAFLTQAGSETAGNSGRTGSSKAQCLPQPAPWSIHRLIVSFCEPVSLRPDFGGGISSSASSVSSRRISSLSPLLPGTMIGSFDRSVLSLRSSLRSALRVLTSGPWQSRQFSDRIGRTSRLNLTGEESPARAANGRIPRIHRPASTRRTPRQTEATATSS